jgi:ABC-type multidrug transport system fused ATPase/permease subunit
VASRRNCRQPARLRNNGSNQASAGNVLDSRRSGARLASATLLCEAMHSRVEQDQEDYMIILGLILLILGWVLGISILWTIGIIVLIIGIVFLVLGQTGRAVGGRKYWY